MGIYTDYGRFQKAREFLSYCNSGAGIWFAFSIGSPRWDNVVHKESGDVLNVPPSSPAAYTPVYRWYASEKNPNWETLTDDVLEPQEYSLIDRSFTEDGNWPTNIDIRNKAIQEEPEPDEEHSPSVLTLFNSSFDMTEHSWSGESDRFYPSKHIPAFPVQYMVDWNTIIEKANSYGYTSLFQSPNDWSEPTDSDKYESWSYIYHLSQPYKNNPYVSGSSTDDTPVGLVSFIRGTAKFVEPVEDNTDSSMSTFKYGSHYWRVVKDSDVDKDHLPHHILLTVSVFPNELSDSSLVERYLPIRQVSVLKFPDCVLEQIPELEEQVSKRSYNVLRRDKFHIVREGDQLPTIDASIPWSTRPVYIPFNCEDPKEPNPDGTGIRGSAEILINDFMSARRRDVQQTDRYGYIIGF